VTKQKASFLGALATLFVFGVSLVSIAEIAVWTIARPRDNGFPAGLFSNRPGAEYAATPRWSGDVTRIHPHHISINSQGYRDGEWGSQHDDPRVLMVGSTALFGLGVEKQDRLSERLARHLNITVHNAGMYGYGPPQALATIRELCHHTSYRTVLYVHEYKLTRNDFMQETARTVVNGELVNVRAPAKFVSTPMEPPWLGQRLRLLALREMLSSHGLAPRQIYENWRGPGSFEEAYFLTRYATTADELSFPPKNVRLAAGYIHEMQSAAQRCGSGFAVVLLPGPAENRFRRSEPATRSLLTMLGSTVPIIDLRHALPHDRQLLLPGLDYFNPAALDEFALRLTGPTKSMLQSRSE
jgi:hypothetical protein